MKKYSFLGVLAAVVFIFTFFGFTPKASAYNPADFVTTWHTTTSSETITIPFSNGGTCTYDIDWGDSGGVVQNYVGVSCTAQPSHVYASAGIYQIVISGTFSDIFFNNSGDKNKIYSIDQWGTNHWTSMYGSYYGCSNLDITATDSPDLSGVTNMHGMFLNASSMNSDLSGWNVSNITDMSSMFYGATAFNNGDSIDSASHPLTWANTSLVINMTYMFQGATSFNQDISSWNTSSVTNMSNMFLSATSFNNGGVALDWANTSAVTTMSSLFQGATSFNQDVSSWDTSSVINMSNMFLSATSFNNGGVALDWADTSSVQDMINMVNGATSFNQDVSSWDTSSVTNMNAMFSGATSFNNGGVALDWANTSLVTDMSNMFSDTNSFNQDISSWDTSSVTNMSSMFYDATAFDNGGVALDWADTSAVINMTNMFSDATSFNQDVSSWNTSSVINMDAMFSSSSTSSFNNGGVALDWADTSSVTSMADMFQGATSFNQDVSSWNTSSVTSMYGLFWSDTSFDQNISSWNVSSVTDMTNMFTGVTLSTSNYDNLLSAWSLQTLHSGVTLHAGNSKYACSATQRTNIINNFSWTIHDGGVDSLVTCNATAFTLSGPSSGQVNNASSNFTIIPGGLYTGTITITLSGGGLTGTTITKTFSHSSAAQTFTITPTSGSIVTLTATNNHSLINPAASTYYPTATSFNLSGPASGAINTYSSNFTITPNGYFTGRITVALSGAGLSNTISKTFTNSLTPQTFTIRPTLAGSVTLASGNNGGLTNPSNQTYISINGSATYYVASIFGGVFSGGVNTASQDIRIAPDGTFTGDITITPSGGGLSTPIVKTFSNSSTAQTFTITPTDGSSLVTLTFTNDGGLADPDPLEYTPSATTYTMTGSSSGNSNHAVTFTVTLNGFYTGTITVTPSGGGLSTPIVLSGTDITPQTFTVTPTSAGTVTFSLSNSGGLTDPSDFTYTVHSTSGGGSSGGGGGGGGGISLCPFGTTGIYPNCVHPVINPVVNPVTPSVTSPVTINLNLLNKMLKIRDKNDTVKILQQALNLINHNSALVPDGSFGPKTFAAVVAFQKSTGLKPDGVVGFYTRAMIRTALHWGI